MIQFNQYREKNINLPLLKISFHIEKVESKFERNNIKSDGFNLIKTFLLNPQEPLPEKQQNSQKTTQDPFRNSKHYPFDRIFPQNSSISIPLTDRSMGLGAHHKNNLFPM